MTTTATTEQAHERKPLDAKGWTPDAAHEAIRQVYEHGYKPVVIIPHTLKKQFEDAGKLPGVFTGPGGWKRQAEWQAKAETATLANLTDWHGQTNSVPNVGVLCGVKTERGYLVAVDIDCDAPEIVEGISKLCGGVVAIRIGKEGRSGLVPLIVDSLDAFEVFKCAEDKIQLLKSGKQFVARGMHPERLEPYRWAQYDAALGEIVADCAMPSVDQLPVVQLTDVLAVFEENGFRGGTGNTSTAGANDRKSELMSELESDDELDGDDFEALFGDDGKFPLSELATENRVFAKNLALWGEDYEPDSDDIRHHDRRVGFYKDIQQKWPALTITCAKVLHLSGRLPGLGTFTGRKEGDGSITDNHIVNAWAFAERAIRAKREVFDYIEDEEDDGRDVPASVRVQAETSDSEANTTKKKEQSELKVYRAAIKATGAPVVESPRSGVWTAYDHLQAFKPQDELVEGLWPMQGLCSVFGDSNSGKTFFVLAAGKALAAGRKFNGGDTVKAGVLYVGCEGREGADARLTALYAPMGADEAEETGLDAEDFAGIDAANTIHTSFDFPTGVSLEEACARFYRIAGQFKEQRGSFPGVLIIDHVIALLPPETDLSAPVAMQSVSNALRQLQHVLDCLIVTLGHTNKNGEYLGSVMQRAGWDRAIRIEKEGEGGESAKHTIHINKWRDGLPGGMSRTFWLVTRKLGKTPRGKVTTSAVVHFGESRGRFPAVVDDSEADARLSEATRMASFDEYPEYLADYMRRQIAGAGDGVNGTTFLSDDLRTDTADALDHFAQRKQIRDPAKLLNQRRGQLARALSNLEKKAVVRLEVIAGKQTLVHML